MPRSSKSYCQTQTPNLKPQTTDGGTGLAFVKYAKQRNPYFFDSCRCKRGSINIIMEKKEEI